MDELGAHPVLGLRNDLRMLRCEAANDPLELRLSVGIGYRVHVALASGEVALDLFPLE